MFHVALIELALLAPTISQANGHFDNSVRATLRSDKLEIKIVIGGEGAVEILKHASTQHLVSIRGMGI